MNTIFEWNQYQNFLKLVLLNKVYSNVRVKVFNDLTISKVMNL